MRLLLAALLLLPLATSGQEADSETGRIAGVVTDAETGEPLVGANVWLVGTTLGAATDVEGRFRILDVPAGDHAVQVTYIAYDRLETAVRVEPGVGTTFLPALQPHEIVCVVEVNEPPTGAPTVVRGETAPPAPATGRVAGTVTEGQTGEPLPGATVLLVGTPRGAATDLDGRYVVAGVPPGEHELRVTFVGYEPTVVKAIVRPGVTTTASMSLPVDDAEPGCIIVCGMPQPFGTGIYAARVVHYTWPFDCCSTERPPIHPAYVRLEDR